MDLTNSLLQNPTIDFHLSMNVFISINMLISWIPNCPHILAFDIIVFMWWHTIIIQSLPKVLILIGFIFIFLELTNIKFNKSNHATFKLGKFKDVYIPTWMLGNKTNIYSFIPPHPNSNVHVEVPNQQKCLKVLAKALRMLTSFILLRWNGECYHISGNCEQL